MSATYRQLRELCVVSTTGSVDTTDPVVPLRFSRLLDQCLQAAPRRLVRPVGPPCWMRGGMRPPGCAPGCARLPLHGQCNRASRTGTLEYAYLRLPIRRVEGLLRGLRRFQVLYTLGVERVRGLVALAALQLLGPIRVRDTQVGLNIGSSQPQQNLHSCFSLILL